MIDPYFCENHQTKWFQKGNMRNFAHPIKDASGAIVGWCNMPKEGLQAHPANTPEANTPEATPSAGPTVRFDTIKDLSIKEQVAVKELGEAIRSGYLAKWPEVLRLAAEGWYRTKVCEYAGIKVTKETK